MLGQHRMKTCGRANAQNAIYQSVAILAVCRTYIFLLKKIGRISDHNSLAGQVRVADVVCNNIEKTYFSVLCAERANRERPRLYRDTTGCC